MPVGATALKAIWAAVKQVLSHSWNRKRARLASGAHDTGSGRRSHGCQPTPHPAHPGGLPGEGVESVGMMSAAHEPQYAPASAA